jgi:hypothetical protein
MRFQILLTATALGALAVGPAHADSCRAMLERMDTATPPARLGPAQKAEVERLREEGQELCLRGDDQRAAEKLAEAEEILGLR